MRETAGRRLSKSEVSLGMTLESIKLPRDVFPIEDPDLAALSELLHRMQTCKSLSPFQWMAGEAIGTLRTYLLKQSKS